MEIIDAATKHRVYVRPSELPPEAASWAADAADAGVRQTA